jgi:hypothetical protein
MTVQAQSGADVFQSENGHFAVSYESQLEPIAINQIHSWTLHITNNDGQAVNNAVVTIVGGMPEHNHGLATEPTIEAIGNGSYLLQGLRFHMMGYWELELTIVVGNVSDKVMIPLEL